MNCVEGNKTGSATTVIKAFSDTERENMARSYCRYDSTHNGQFIVYVDAIPGEQGRRPINVLSLSRSFKKLDIKNRLEESKIGYGRCKVLLKDYLSANALMDDERLKKEV